VVLFAGTCVAVGAGTVAAIAAPSWQDDGAQHITATVVARDGDHLTLDELLTYEPIRGGVGTIEVAVDDPGTARVGESVDLDIVRRDGSWTARALTILDPN
jgi:hypothetical protein